MLLRVETTGAALFALAEDGFVAFSFQDVTPSERRAAATGPRTGLDGVAGAARAAVAGIEYILPLLRLSGLGLCLALAGDGITA